MRQRIVQFDAPSKRRRLLDLERDRFEEAADHPYREGQGEGQVGEPEAEAACRAGRRCGRAGRRAAPGRCRAPCGWRGWRRRAAGSGRGSGSARRRRECRGRSRPPSRPSDTIAECRGSPRNRAATSRPRSWPGPSSSTSSSPPIRLSGVKRGDRRPDQREQRHHRGEDADRVEEDVLQAASAHWRSSTSREAGRRRRSSPGRRRRRRAPRPGRAGTPGTRSGRRES